MSFLAIALLWLMLYICHNFTKIGVGNQRLPDPYSSASFGTDKGWQSLPLDTLAPLAWAHWHDGHTNNWGW